MSTNYNHSILVHYLTNNNLINRMNLTASSPTFTFALQCFKKLSKMLLLKTCVTRETRATVKSWCATQWGELNIWQETRQTLLSIHSIKIHNFNIKIIKTNPSRALWWSSENQWHSTAATQWKVFWSCDSTMWKDSCSLLVEICLSVFCPCGLNWRMCNRLAGQRCHSLVFRS